MKEAATVVLRMQQVEPLGRSCHADIKQFALLKRAWYGSHHHYSKSYMPLYIAEASWKYNRRKSKNLFDMFITGCFQ